MTEVHSLLELLNGIGACSIPPIEDPPLRREDILRATTRIELPPPKLIELQPAPPPARSSTAAVVPKV
jgi:hypothetical protein